jgi:hypothetical protein
MSPALGRPVLSRTVQVSVPAAADSVTLNPPISSSSMSMHPNLSQVRRVQRFIFWMVYLQKFGTGVVLGQSGCAAGCEDFLLRHPHRGNYVSFFEPTISM